LAQQVSAAVSKLRKLDLTKPPGIAEAVNWASALLILGGFDETAALGTVLKHPEDHEVARLGRA
jgi:hypothetical protein